MSASRPTSRAVVKRKGRLQRSIRYSKAVPKGSSASATFSITAKYAGVHIGKKRGGSTRISASGGKSLAIPLPDARDGRGVPIAGPRSRRWKPTFLVGSVIYGFPNGRADAAKALFVLKKSVVVPQRINVDRDIVKPAQKIYKQHIRKGLKQILS